MISDRMDQLFGGAPVAHGVKPDLSTGLHVFRVYLGDLSEIRDGPLLLPFKH